MSWELPHMKGRNWKSSSPHTPWLPAGSIRYVFCSFRITCRYLDQSQHTDRYANEYMLDLTFLPAQKLKDIWADICATQQAKAYKQTACTFRDAVVYVYYKKPLIYFYIRNHSKTGVKDLWSGGCVLYLEIPALICWLVLHFRSFLCEICGYVLHWWHGRTLLAQLMKFNWREKKCNRYQMVKFLSQLLKAKTARASFPRSLFSSNI